MKTGKQKLPPYRYDPPVAQPHNRIGQQQHKKSEESQDLPKQKAIDIEGVLVPMPGAGRMQPPGTSGGVSGAAGWAAICLSARPGAAGMWETPSCPPHPPHSHAKLRAVAPRAAGWDTHKYVKERGLKIVLEDFVLQVLLNAILGLKRRQEMRKLLSALIRN